MNADERAVMLSLASAGALFSGIVASQPRITDADSKDLHEFLDHVEAARAVIRSRANARETKQAAATLQTQPIHAP